VRICRIILSVLLVCLSLLTACSQPTDEEVYYKIQKKLGELETYECTTKVSAVNGEETTEYVYKQYFKNPNSYRLELILPEATKGNLMVSNGKMAWVYSPSINHTYKIDSVEKLQNELLFIGFFMKNYMSSKESDITSDTINKEQFIVITTDIPGGNYYFSKQKLWFDRNELVPTQLEILDEQNKIVFKVHYEDFIFNPKLDDGIFHLNIQPE